MFAKRFRELRLERQLSQKEIGAYLKVTGTTISMYETGQREPDFETVSRIASYFGVSTDYMLGRTDARNDVPKVDLAEKWPLLSADRRLRAYYQERSAKGLPGVSYFRIPTDATDDRFDAIMRSFGTVLEILATKRPDQE